MLENVYIAAHDFILPRGCCSGAGCANCDYNDNVYILSNVIPASPGAHIPSVPVGSSSLVLNFDTAYPDTTLQGLVNISLPVHFIIYETRDIM